MPAANRCLNEHQGCMWKISTSKEAIQVELGVGHALFHRIHPKQNPDHWAIGHIS